MTRCTLSVTSVAALVVLWSAEAFADDIVHLANGGRLRGVVVEQDPARGTTVQLSDGSFRYLTPAEVASCEYGVPPVALPPSDAAQGAAPAGAAAAPPASAPSQGASPPDSTQGAPVATPDSGPTVAPPPPPPVVLGPPPSQIYGVYPPPPPSRPASAPAPVWTPGQPVPQRLGFQLGVRLGGAFPHGKLSGEEGALRRYVGAQTMLQFDLGWKTSPQWLFGGYLGLGFGSVGDVPRVSCDALNVDCRSQLVRLGFLVQYHFRPAARLNPWLEYGIGVESTMYNDIEAGSSGQYTRKRTLSGLEWGLLGAGVDWRPHPTFGLGLFVRESLGTFSSTRQEGGSAVDSTSEIHDQTAHGWFMVGVRGVLYP